MECDVILRTCNRVYTVHASGDGGKNQRIPGPKFTKLDIMTRCVSSLITSMNLVDSNFVDLRLIVVDDHSSNVGIRKIKSLMKKCKCPTEFISLENGTGNGASLKACYDWARSNGKEYLFFVEDDYLHDPACLPEMLYELEFFKIKLKNHEVALFPYDNIDNYMQASKNSVPCFMMIGSKRHWRTVTNATSTFLCSKNILERYWYLFERMEDDGKDPSVSEDTTTNLIWTAPYRQAGGAYLLSPIPSLSLHFHFNEHLAPFIDWKKWWDESKEEKTGSKVKNYKDYS
jgi:glycosyltransferase involved in cell wall biosynthesis